MAQRPLRICAQPGCNELVRASRCPRHARAKGRGTSKNRPGDPFYSRKAWRRLRQRRLELDNYLCQDCLDDGHLTPATQVDHVKDRVDHPELEIDLENTRGLCDTHHNRKTAKTQARKRRRHGSEGKTPKPTALHVTEGTFRKKDHAKRVKEPKAKGAPVPPEWLDEVAREHWFAVVGPLVQMNVAKALDTHALAMLCDAWSRWRSLRTLCGDDAELKAKHAYALSRLLKDWLDIGGRFGMTASDRTRIEVEGDTPVEAAERFVV